MQASGLNFLDTGVAPGGSGLILVPVAPAAADLLAGTLTAGSALALYSLVKDIGPVEHTLIAAGVYSSRPEPIPLARRLVASNLGLAWAKKPGKEFFLK
jgi:hypothetical protein